MLPAALTLDEHDLGPRRQARGGHASDGRSRRWIGWLSQDTRHHWRRRATTTLSMDPSR